MKKIRLYENLHIVFWLMKDSCWLLQWKIPGTIMIFPTLFMALYISWKTRNDPFHLLPNMAVTCWISANITWMLGEFYGWAHVAPASIFFLCGLILIIRYFILIMRHGNPED